MFDRFKKPASGEDSGAPRNPETPNSAPGGFGRRQNPVASGIAANPAPAAPGQSGGFGRRTSPVPGRTQTSQPTPQSGTDKRLAIVSQVGGKIAGLLSDAYRDERGVHVETIVAGAAVLAGEFALRASVPFLPDTGWIAGGPADALIFRGFPDKRMTMWSVVQVVVLSAGADISQLPNMDVVATRASASIAAKSFPPKLSVPTEHFPHEFSPNAGPRFRDAIFAIAQENGLDPTETALALAFTVGLLIKRSYGIVAIDVLATLAAELMLAMTRIAPLKAPIQ